MQIIFLISGPNLRLDAYLDYNIENLMKHYDVSFYSMKSLNNKDYSYNNHQLVRSLKTIHINSIQMLKDMVNHFLEPTLIINIGDENLFKYFVELRNNFCYFARLTKTSTIERFYKELSIHRFMLEPYFIVKSFVKIIINYEKKMHRKKYKDFTVDFVFSNYNNNKFLYKNLIYFHSAKYDEHLLKNISSENNLGEYILFLDSNIPFHPDYKTYSIGPPLNARKYFDLMNIFFNELEKKYKC